MKRNLLYLCLLAFWALFPSKATGQYVPDDYTTSEGWSDIDNGVVFTNGDVVRIPIFCIASTKIIGVAYLEAKYQRTYINKATFKIHIKPEYNNEDLGVSYNINDSHIVNDYPNTLSDPDGKELSLDSVNQYLHIQITYPFSYNGGIRDFNGWLDLIVSNWSNITKSTSENYSNYLSKTETKSADSFGDYTSYLSTTWTSDNISSLSASDNWTGATGNVFVIITVR